MTFAVRLGANARRDFDRHLAHFATNDDLWYRVAELENDLLGRRDFIAANPFLRRKSIRASDTRH